MRGRSTHMALVISVCLAMLTAGCSGGGREYSVPKDLCGIPVPEKVLSPLLPRGEKLDMWEERTSDSSKVCRLTVDRVRVLSVHVSHVEKFYDPMAESEEYKFTDRKKMGKLPFDGAGAVGDKNAMVTARCGAPEPPYLIVDALVDEKANEDVSQRREDVAEFITAFTPKVKEEVGCDA